MRRGSDGIDNDRSPGRPVHVDMYAEGHKVRARRLPLYLLDAIRAFDRDKSLKAMLGDSFSASYVKLKMQEWGRVLEAPHGVGANDDARLLSTPGID